MAVANACFGKRSLLLDDFRHILHIVKRKECLEEIKASLKRSKFKETESNFITNHQASRQIQWRDSLGGWRLMLCRDCAWSRWSCSLSNRISQFFANFWPLFAQTAVKSRTVILLQNRNYFKLWNALRMQVKTLRNCVCTVCVCVCIAWCILFVWVRCV